MFVLDLGQIQVAGPVHNSLIEYGNEFVQRE